MELATVRAVEGIAFIDEVRIYERAFLHWAVKLAYAILLLPSPQRLMSPEVYSASSHGALLESERRNRTTPTGHELAHAWA